jgi:hypothetical protein
MTRIDREQFLDSIRTHIADAGHHVTMVHGGSTPRFAYTIGLSEAGLPELVLAGAASLSADAAFAAIEAAAAHVRSAASPGDGEPLDVPDVGRFTFAPVHVSWKDELLLGALDYYDRDDIPALQLIPSGPLRTIDVPDLAAAFDPDREPVWRWLVEPWELDVPASTFVLTNLKALHGEPVSQAGRWESDHWELLAGSEVAEDDARAVPLATLLAFDPSLEPATRLAVGEAIRRDPPGPWQAWEA